MTTVTRPVAAGLDVKKLLHMYRQMVAIRLFEEQVNDLYTRALMPGLAHLYIGEEAVAVGVCEALHARRLHHEHASRPRPLPGEGRRTATGCLPNCSARKPATATARAARCTLPIPTPATSARTRSSAAAPASRPARRSHPSASATGRVAVCFFGEGALGQGVLYEVMNLAPLWKLPVIYVCENNLYNEYTHCSGDDGRRHPGAAGGVRRSRPKRVDGQDVRAVYAAAAAGWSTRARRVTGPAFLLCDTYRYHGHHVGDINREYYRSKAGRAGVDDGARSDQAVHGQWLMAEGLADRGSARADHGAT